ncbi:S1-like domain-containing RNA-binding protein [Gracilibacillus caseinilyticus]|uniref:S1-like domain-containing RNA-binding protein n=2 Tax=Gracilibacillus caseinilyticus TaxID=2932256 RepID=A0ABY4F328_9BACI|nr:S1-like domain-containing RNA-binding protein [Gracilibacillus caseinilyticus]UOQ50478.1 S1-like domain-containing RNA-binding protein [Gracilibacillus caseinilyticus]
MNQIGTIQTLEVLRKIDTGYVLAGDILLHHNETEQELEAEQAVDVFVYQDKKGQTVATTQVPAIQIDTYGWAEVVEVLPHLGVFVNIGTTKEILVSKDELPLFIDVWPIVGDELYVSLGKDRKGRLLALPATEGIFERMFESAPDDLFNETISGRIYRTDREGAVCITEAGYRGFIHHTERKEEPRLGEQVEGRVIEVKHDGTLNVSLRPLKQHSMCEDADEILAQLEESNGVLPFSDKSNPDEIRETFNISKAAFKRALGKLMKERKIEQRDGKTYLISE